MGLVKGFGDDLLSHTVTRAVPSALKSLTSVFGMGTGGSSSLLSPKIRNQMTEDRSQKMVAFGKRQQPFLSLSHQ
jgi:hypothetical protein